MAPCNMQRISRPQSRLRRRALDLERRARQLGRLGLHRSIDAHARQRAADHAAREPEELHCDELVRMDSR